MSTMCGERRGVGGLVVAGVLAGTLSVVGGVVYLSRTNADGKAVPRTLAIPRGKEDGSGSSINIHVHDGGGGLFAQQFVSGQEARSAKFVNTAFSNVCAQAVANSAGTGLAEQITVNCIAGSQKLKAIELAGGIRSNLMWDIGPTRRAQLGFEAWIRGAVSPEKCLVCTP